MSRAATARLRRGCLVAAWAAWASTAVADQPPRGLSPAPWSLEAVELRDGRRLEGLITAPPPDGDPDADVFFVQVVRRPGRPMYLIAWGPLGGERVAARHRLPPDEHARLAARIEAFRADRERRLDVERAIELERGAAAGAWRYATDDFLLESTADAGITREAALRLTNLFGAIANLVPPVVPGGTPTTVRLCGTPAEYLAEQEALGIQVANPAFYVPERRLLVAGSDMPATVARWRAAADANATAARRLAELDRRLPERLRELTADLERQGMSAAQRGDIVTKARGRWHRERAAEQARIETANRENDARVTAARREFYGRLAHETWHAYAATRLRPADGAGLPDWLDEGLAQVLETAPLEAGELRLDAADPGRVAALTRMLQDGTQPPLSDVIRAGAEQFIAGHAAALEAPSRAYLVAWGLAFDIAVLEPVLTPAGVADLGGGDGADPVARFERLVGMPLRQFETAWQRRIAALRPPAVGRPVTPAR